jgi:hypothetical protein
MVQLDFQGPLAPRGILGLVEKLVPGGSVVLQVITEFLVSLDLKELWDDKAPQAVLEQAVDPVLTGPRESRERRDPWVQLASPETRDQPVYLERMD